MKRTVVFVFAAAVLILGVNAFAQEQGNDNDVITVVTVQIQKVYPHRLGYKIIYNRSDLYPAEAYLPGRWFTEAAGKGEIIFAEDPSVPYMTIFWRNGEFDHVRLFVHANPADRSWGALPSDLDLTEEFQVETLDLKF